MNITDTLLSNLKWISEKYNISLNGVLHLGAHLGQEAAIYSSLDFDVVWVEGHPEIFKQLQRNLLPYYPRQIAIQALISDTDNNTASLYVTNNNSESSSVLAPDENIFSREWKGIEVVNKIELKTKRIDTLLKENKIDSSKYNILIIDLQGYELTAMKGMGEILDNIEIISTEVNLGHIYKGADLLHNIDGFLLNRGFTRVWLSMSGVQGEAWYVRRDTGSLKKLFIISGDYISEYLYRSGILRLLKKNHYAFSILRRLYYKIHRRQTSVDEKR